jgi:hypothetical protein
MLFEHVTLDSHIGPMASGGDFFSRLRRFDAYPKTLDDFREKTFSGAAGNSWVILKSYGPFSFYFGWGNNAYFVRLRDKLLSLH